MEKEVERAKAKELVDLCRSLGDTKTKVEDYKYWSDENIDQQIKLIKKWNGLE